MFPTANALTSQILHLTPATQLRTSPSPEHSRDSPLLRQAGAWSLLTDRVEFLVISLHSAGEPLRRRWRAAVGATIVSRTLSASVEVSLPVAGSAPLDAFRHLAATAAAMEQANSSASSCVYGGHGTNLDAALPRSSHGGEAEFRGAAHMIAASMACSIPSLSPDRTNPPVGLGQVRTERGPHVVVITDISQHRSVSACPPPCARSCASCSGRRVDGGPIGSPFESWCNHDATDSLFHSPAPAPSAQRADHRSRPPRNSFASPACDLAAGYKTLSVC